MKRYKEFLKESEKPLLDDKEELVNKLKELLDQMTKMNDGIRNNPWPMNYPQQRRRNINNDFCYRFAIPYYVELTPKGEELFSYELNDDLKDSVYNSIENAGFDELCEYYDFNDFDMIDSVVDGFNDENSTFIVKCCFDRNLKNDEIDQVKDYISGQCSDGIGEGFDQEEHDYQDQSFFVSTWWHGNKKGKIYRIELVDDIPDDDSSFEDDFDE